ncbi:olfactory receptor 10A7-like [Gopherus flavomarginatus]|uniref:olfactory receptor 10A7-like n=1 Tax=Gopherus flavomarginatus TaxID=286002 RepID=UPI0021CBB43B|nr:olfactory receptor 10A7-like [Gopherus flavomarginatus]
MRDHFKLEIYQRFRCRVLPLVCDVYDRYLAICKPLHYAALMNGMLCLQLAAGSWINGLLVSSTMTSLISQLFFCGPNEVDHFFCDFTPVKKLSCSKTRLMDIVAFLMTAIFTLPLFLLTLTSYICIITTILRVPSTTGRKKAFSTCSSHLIDVTTFYGTLMIVYMLPDTNTLKVLNKVFSILYTALTPMVNPLIYSLRNREVKEALRRAINAFLTFMGVETGSNSRACIQREKAQCGDCK